jgi:hypothetical protein
LPIQNTPQKDQFLNLLAASKPNFFSVDNGAFKKKSCYLYCTLQNSNREQLKFCKENTKQNQ